MRQLTDKEMRFLLADRGYDVPLLVIRTWTVHQHRTFSFTVPNRKTVERWLTHGICGRKPKFPQFLAPFDINILRRYNRIQEQQHETPRLWRIA